ncbi:MAG: GDP-L-fucose synthase family protein [Candidatus Thorarchaeota archaeon]
MEHDSLIYVAGHTGLVGSAILRTLEKRKYSNLLLRTHQELDLTVQGDVKKFFEEYTPEYVIITAGRVGGILANVSNPAEFIYDNLLIQSNVIHHAYTSGTKKLLALGSSCIYPKHSDQPISEKSLLTGVLEPTNEYYAISKIAALKMCTAYRRQYGVDFISAMPTNLYGPNDNYDLASSHVLPALLRKFHEAKINNTEEIVIWGTGTPRREFLYVDDLADGLLFLMKHYSDDQHINIGTGVDVTILELANIIQEVVGYHGDLVFDKSKPDGMLRKLLDIRKIRELGWESKTKLRDGLSITYDWFVKNYNDLLLYEANL